MKYVLLESTNPNYNLATEEYFMKQKDFSSFLLWTNNNCIVIGKNQNAYNEVNMEYVKKNNIQVVRRLSGGGAVFHDLGNLNFTFILNNEINEVFNFAKFTKPLIDTLKKIGINAKHSGKNDVLINGKKFSGNAQYIHNQKLLHHGTIMFSVMESNLINALKINELKIKSKGIKSVSSRVTNITNHLKKEVTLEQFKQNFLNEIKKNNENFEEYKITDLDKQAIEKLVNEKYSQWDYVFGQNPEYDFNNKMYFENAGLVEVFLNIKNGRIKDIKFYGDFFAKKDLVEIYEKLVNIKHDYKEIKKILDSFKNFNDYFHNIQADKIAKLICCFE